MTDSSPESDVCQHTGAVPPLRCPWQRFACDRIPTPPHAVGTSGRLLMAWPSWLTTVRLLDPSRSAIVQTASLVSGACPAVFGSALWSTGHGNGQRTLTNTYTSAENERSGLLTETETFTAIVCHHRSKVILMNGGYR